MPYVDHRGRKVAPARSVRRSALEDVPPLWQFVFLSMLLHALLIALFGAPSGGSRQGRAMWGSLEGVINAPGAPEPLGLRVERRLRPEPAPTPPQASRIVTPNPAPPPPPRAKEQLEPRPLPETVKEAPTPKVLPPE